MKSILSYNPKYIEFMLKDIDTGEVTLHFKSGTEISLGKISEDEYNNIDKNIKEQCELYTPYKEMDALLNQEAFKETTNEETN